MTLIGWRALLAWLSMGASACLGAQAQPPVPPDGQPAARESATPAPAPGSAPADHGATELEAKLGQPVFQSKISVAPLPKEPAKIKSFLNRLTADLLSRAVIARLREIDQPTTDQYRVTALGLRIAQRYAPDDAEMLRQQIEAWESAQEHERSQASTRELIRLDPKDTVAQLRLVTARIANLQDADQRLKSYASLLKPGALDKSVQARLALDAALLSRENGDQRAFLDRLTLATTLDPAFKEAVALYVTYFLDQTKDPRERFDLMSMLLLADPLDPEAHRNTAYELRRRGAFLAAGRFLELARNINSAAGEQQSLAQLVDYQLTVWDSMGPDKCLDELQKMLDLQQVSEDLRRQRLKDSGRDPGPEVELRHPTPLERLRLAIRVARSDDAGTALSMTSLEGTYKESVQAIDNNPPTPEIAAKLRPEQRPAAQKRARLSEWVWLRLFAGMKLEGVESDIDALSKPGDDEAPPISEVAQQRFRGWLHVIRGELAEAKAMLEPIANEDPSARWALGILAQKQGDKAKALEIFERLANDESASALGSTARLRWERLKGLPMPKSPVAAGLDNAGKSFAPWLDGAVNDPRSIMTLSVTPAPLACGALDRMEAVVRLTNTSRARLAVGAGRTINPRLLITARALVGGRDVTNTIKPEVLMLTRRLGLNTGESVEATFCATRSDVGRALDARPSLSADLRFLVTQGFIFSEAHEFKPGPGSQKAQSEVAKRMLITGAQAPDALAPRVLSAAWPELPECLALGAYLVNPARRGSDIDPVSEQDAKSLQAALLQRYPSLAPCERALVVDRLAICGGLSDDARSVVAESLKTATDAGEIGVTLLAAAQGPDDPVLAAVKPGSDEELSEFIALVKSCFTQAAVSAGGGATPAVGK